MHACRRIWIQAQESKGKRCLQCQVAKWARGTLDLTGVLMVKYIYEWLSAFASAETLTIGLCLRHQVELCERLSCFGIVILKIQRKLCYHLSNLDE
jgi:hypothetical protein